MTPRSPRATPTNGHAPGTDHEQDFAPLAQSSVLSPQSSVVRPFRAADVLTGRIDTRRSPAARSARGRKQISAQLAPAQIRLLGEIHARLNATAATRIEKSDLVGLGIELLAAVLTAGEGLDPAPDPDRTGPRDGAAEIGQITDLDTLRRYVRTHVRAYEEGVEG